MSMPKENRFYAPEEFTHTLTQMREILKRESVGKPKEKSLSEWIREQIAEYVSLHQSGNPQQRIDTVLKIGKAYHAETCQMCGSKPTRFGLKNDVWLGFCAIHWEPRKFKTWK